MRNYIWFPVLFSALVVINVIMAFNAAPDWQFRSLVFSFLIISIGFGFLLKPSFVEKGEDPKTAKLNVKDFLSSYKGILEVIGIIGAFLLFTLSPSLKDWIYYETITVNGNVMMNRDNKIELADEALVVVNLVGNGPIKQFDVKSGYYKEEFKVPKSTDSIEVLCLKKGYKLCENGSDKTGGKIVPLSQKGFVQIYSVNFEMIKDTIACVLPDKVKQAQEEIKKELQNE